MWEDFTMILAIDIGNTNMEFGVYKQDEIIASFRVITNREITSDELGLTMMQFFFPAMLHCFWW